MSRRQSYWYVDVERLALMCAEYEITDGAYAKIPGTDRKVGDFSSKELANKANEDLKKKQVPLL